MNDTSGFYKYKDEVLIYGQNEITGPYFDLLRENHDQYDYPVDGWYWFDTEQEARIFFNLSLVE